MQPWVVCTTGITFILVLGCASNAGQGTVERVAPFHGAPLYGMVYDDDNRPCSAASVLLDGRRRAEADRDGRFILSRVEPGHHTIRLRKAGYEELVVEIDFEDPAQVLYARMVSLEQLLADAERAISNAAWGPASVLLRRAGAAGASDEAVEFLYAILDYKLERFVEAEERLRRLLSVVRDPPPPVLYLFLAELYEHHLDRPVLAAESLEHYLHAAGDPAARARLEQLRSILASGHDGSGPDGQGATGRDPSPSGMPAARRASRDAIASPDSLRSGKAGRPPEPR